MDERDAHGDHAAFPTAGPEMIRSDEENEGGAVPNKAETHR